MVNRGLSEHGAIIGMPILPVNRHTDSLYRHASGMTLGERIRHARELRELTQTALAKMPGIKQPSLSELESGETKEAMSSTLRGLANALRVRYDWLATEDGPMEEDHASPTRVARDEPLPYKPRPDVIEVPVFDVVASMGLGAAVPEHDQVIDHLRLMAPWVRKTFPGISGTQNLAVISAIGSSMNPTFSDGDILMIDRGVSNLRTDDVYVLEFHEELYIKRIQRRPDGSVAIISDNKVYDPIVVPAGEKESIRVLGRVVWAWRGGKP